MLDSNMNGSVHASNLMKVCAGRLAFLYRYSSLLDKKSRQTLCASLIQPHIDYCCSLWYSSLSVVLKERLNVIQRKMVRFVNGLDYRGHVDNKTLKDLLWLNIPDRVKFFKMSHLFRIRNKLAPSYLLPNFKFVSDAHTHNTRGSSHNFHLSRQLSLSPNSFSFTAIVGGRNAQGYWWWWSTERNVTDRWHGFMMVTFPGPLSIVSHCLIVLHNN